MSVFFTGFPGFIAGNIIKKMASGDPALRFELLVHPSQTGKARAEVSRLVEMGYGPGSRFSLIPGDITQEGLGFDHSVLQRLKKDVTHVFHLAALYDLAVPREIAFRVNVTGTGHVNQFVQQLPDLKRYVYFSTAYVSGRRTGRILETELDCGQGFKNFYEYTKFEAEKLVQEIRSSVPTTIIRPAVVMGDSRTGETAKFDGAYFIMRFLDRFRRFPIPYVGKGASPFNVVPVDYAVDAAVYLAHSDIGKNKVYHLTDPVPSPARETYKMVCQEMLGKQPSWTVPAFVISGALSIPAFRRWVRVEKETLEYFRIPAEYDSSQAQKDLEGSGIRCPGLKEYLPVCAAYYKAHRDDPDKMIPVR
jgi:nucleoside-diphosphate-sugar epimerase